MLDLKIGKNVTEAVRLAEREQRTRSGSELQRKAALIFQEFVQDGSRSTGMTLGSAFFESSVVPTQLNDSGRLAA